jgi:hypothetical protein
VPNFSLYSRSRTLSLGSVDIPHKSTRGGDLKICAQGGRIRRQCEGGVRPTRRRPRDWIFDRGHRSPGYATPPPPRVRRGRGVDTRGV